MPGCKVFKVSPDGNVECVTDYALTAVPEDYSEKAVAFAQASIDLASTGSSEKLDLAIHLLRMLKDSALEDTSVSNRKGAILNTVKELLEPEVGTAPNRSTPSSMLLYNFSTLPAQALGPWVLARQNLQVLNELYDTFTGEEPVSASLSSHGQRDELRVSA